MKPRRVLVLAVATLVLLAVLGAAAGLAVMVTAALPVALALGAAVLTLVAGSGARLRRWRRGQRLHRGTPGESVWPDAPETDAPGPGPGDGGAPGRHWSTWWEDDPPVQAVPQVREQVAVVLGGWGLTGELAEPTLLVVTELLSNAIDHARGPVGLSVDLSAETVHVEVRDATPHPPRLQPPDPTRARGRGVQFVDALSVRWGWTPAPPGKVVWADVATRWPT